MFALMTGKGLLCGVGAVLALAAATPALATAAPKRYIVVLEDSADPDTVAADHGRRFRAQVADRYRTALKGYVGDVPEERVEALRRDPRVRYVEPDAPMTTQAQTLPWGIDRIDADRSTTLAGNGSGTVGGVGVFVIDSGIASHPDLGLAGHVNFAGGRNTDCNGHGTHVAGTAAARDDTANMVGVAPGAALVGVKVLACNGSGATSGVIRGVDWVTANARGSAVVNMSLGGGASAALDDAVRRSVARGITYAVAAGNDGRDACASSPARAGAGSNGIITVAATDSAEREASFSNYGRCVDVWAPGVGVLSTRAGGGTTTFSGTSMASPHVAGAAALLLSRQPGASPGAVESAIIGAAVATGTASKDGRAIRRVSVAGF